MEKTIIHWCPCLGRQVKMECDLTIHHELPVPQIAKPKVCLELRQHGCTYHADPECLLGKEIQGNFLRKVAAS